jgi:hypothetical protein
MRTMRIGAEQRERLSRIINMWTWFVSPCIWESGTGVLFIQVDDMKLSTNKLSN